MSKQGGLVGRRGGKDGEGGGEGEGEGGGGGGSRGQGKEERREKCPLSH